MMNSISLRIGSRTGRLPPRTAFTLIELLVAIAIIAILAGLLTTAIAKAKTKAQGIACLGNVRQLALAWLLYAGDNNERLAYNFGGPTNRGIAPKSAYNWVNNIMSWELDPDNTNTTFVSQGNFAGYANRTAGIYRCPADRALSQIQRRAGWTARVRSYSMNAMVGDAGENSRYGTNFFNPQYKQFKKSMDFPGWKRWNGGTCRLPITTARRILRSPTGTPKPIAGSIKPPNHQPGRMPRRFLSRSFPPNGLTMTGWFREQAPSSARPCRKPKSKTGSNPVPVQSHWICNASECFR